MLGWEKRMPNLLGLRRRRFAKGETLRGLKTNAEKARRLLLTIDASREERRKNLGEAEEELAEGLERLKALRGAAVKRIRPMKLKERMRDKRVSLVKRKIMELKKKYREIDGYAEARRRLEKIEAEYEAVLEAYDEKVLEQATSDQKSASNRHKEFLEWMNKAKLGEEFCEQIRSVLDAAFETAEDRRRNKVIKALGLSGAEEVSG